MEPCTQLKRINRMKLKGYLLLLLLIIFTSFGYVWTDNLFNSFNKPFSYVYINYSFKTIFLLIYYLKEKFKKRFGKEVDFSDHISRTRTTFEYNLENIDDDTFSETMEKIQIEKRIEYEKNLCKIVSIIMILYSLPMFLLVYGMFRTCDSRKFTISNFCTGFVLVEKIILYNGKCSIVRFVALIFLYTGCILFVQIKELDGKDTYDVIGDICIFVAILLYSFYLNVIKYYSKLYKHYFDFIQILGFIGLYVLIFIPFAIFFLILLNIEILSLPSFEELRIILLLSIMSLVNDLLICNSVIMLSPHLVSSGYNFYYPILITYNIIIGKQDFDLFYLLGMILMLISFIMFVLEHTREYFQRTKKALLEK
jgi:drug/metabolite transporter (DMT)-like permease